MLKLLRVGCWVKSSFSSSDGQLDASGDHEAERNEDGKVHGDGAKNTFRWPTESVTNCEHKAADKDDTLEDDGDDWEPESDNDRAEDQEVEVLEEVDLAALTVAHSEPVSVGELLAEATIASVGVAPLGRSFLARESLSVFFIELFHEGASERLNSGAHRRGVHSGNVLEDDCHSKDEDPEEFLGDHVLALGDAFDLHLIFFDSFN